MEILDEVNKIVNGERLDTYGSPEDSFENIAALWNVHLCARHISNLYELTAEDVAVMMTYFKLARMYGQAYSRDNPRDAIGYLAILADRIKGNGGKVIPPDRVEDAPEPAFPATEQESFDYCMTTLRSFFPQSYISIKKEYNKYTPDNAPTLVYAVYVDTMGIHYGDVGETVEAITKRIVAKKQELDNSYEVDKNFYQKDEDKEEVD